MNNEKYLPVGTVVILKGGETKLFVAGFAVQGDGEEKIYDYIGYLYPEGVISTEENYLFDHEQIERIFYLGYKDEEWLNYEKEIKESVGNGTNTVNDLSDF